MRISTTIARGQFTPGIEHRESPRLLAGRRAEHPINHIEELLPWNVAAQLPRADETQSLAVC
jgi:hypothetical protein